ncbi:MAG: DNA-directed RNA polymerase subunit RPC12/RpoP [Cyclobacteriaceae bacterium]|jgi:DNA-directed RNA polymerase subunit RPC12/RpoP
MALIKCPECEKEISDKANSCPNCGYELNPKPKELKEPPKHKNDGSGCGTWIVVIGVIFLILYLIGSFSDDNSSSNSPSGSTNKFLAYTYAEDFVKKKLKSPGTAEFPGTFEKADHITELRYNKYKIVSWVDSQNGFGAMIRTNFSCIIEFNGNEVSCNELQFYD